MIEAWLRIPLWALVLTDAGNGLLPVWLQAITGTGTGLLSAGTVGTNFNDLSNLCQENVFENVACKKWG